MTAPYTPTPPLLNAVARAETDCATLDDADMLMAHPDPYFQRLGRAAKARIERERAQAHRYLSSLPVDLPPDFGGPDQGPVTGGERVVWFICGALIVGVWGAAILWGLT